MNQPPNASQNAPTENKFPPILRAIDIAVLVLVLWSIDKAVVRLLTAGSVWRNVIGGIIICLGLGTVLWFTDRPSNKNS